MIGFTAEDLAVLRCPVCRELLEWRGVDGPAGIFRRGVLVCAENHCWDVMRAIPDLADRRQLRPKDRLMDGIYDMLAPVHELSVTYLLPLLQYPDPDSVRAAYINAMALKAFDGASETVRVLDIGTGTGASIPMIHHAARKASKLQVWAVDLNEKMVASCARNHAKDHQRLRLGVADAHCLPFADSSFDRVLHVGGINIYRDAAQGLAEMARVARPDTPIVVVDEGLDENRRHNALHRLAFHWLTSLDKFSEAPTELVPDNCEIVEVGAVSRFYYCLVFKKREAPSNDQLDAGFEPQLASQSGL